MGTDNIIAAFAPPLLPRPPQLLYRRENTRLVEDRTLPDGQSPGIHHAADEMMPPNETMEDGGQGDKY